MNLPKPTDSELAILQELWKRGPSTVKVIHEALSATRDIGYTTALKLMQIMHEKGLLTRKREGKTHIYQPAVSQEKNSESTTQQIGRYCLSGFCDEADHCRRWAIKILLLMN